MLKGWRLDSAPTKIQEIFGRLSKEEQEVLGDWIENQIEWEVESTELHYYYAGDE